MNSRPHGRRQVQRRSTERDARDRRRITDAADALREVMRALRLSTRRAERGAAGISGAQRAVLQQLADEPAGSVNELAARTFTSHSSTSVVITRLEGRGLVARRTDPIDARRSTIELTPSGLAVLRRAPASADARLTDALSHLGSKRLSAIASDLRQVAAELRET